MTQTTKMAKIGPRETASVCFDLGRHGSVLRLNFWIFRSGSKVGLFSRKEEKETPCSIPGKEIPNLACFWKATRIRVKNWTTVMIPMMTTVARMVGKLYLFPGQLE